MRYSHPVSGEPVEGIKLGTGAILNDFDRFDATNGHWILCLSPGLTIQPGCQTIWIRTNTNLPPGSRKILRLMSLTDAMLLNQMGQWRIVCNTGARGTNEPMEGDLQAAGAIQGLVDHGLICQDKSDQLYKITDAGREFVQLSMDPVPANVSIKYV